MFGKRFLFMLPILGIALFLQACQTAHRSETFELKYLNVELDIDPEKGDPGETITFTASVTYGDEPVEDAWEVLFEIWRAHDPEHEQFPAEHSGDGIYRIEKAFEREGTYYVIAHVTARDMHTMPRREFVIGTESEPEERPSSSIMGDGGLSTETDY